MSDTKLREMVRKHVARVYNFCSRMTLESGEAMDAVYGAFARAAVTPSLPTEERELSQWLLRRACELLAPRLAPLPEVDFDLLDETLRSEATRTGEVRSLTNPQREFLLWELKQGCMTSVANCLPPAERVAFVLSSVMGMSDEEGARTLAIKESAFKVRLSRARKKVADYLAPRCEHVDPRNPCHCPSRIGIALSKGFIAPPPRSEVSLRLRSSRPFEETPRASDAVDIFRTLPEPEPPAPLIARLEAALATGTWRE